jgi:hypothetical protein
MIFQIAVHKLRQIAILWTGDFYDLAVLMLRGYDACASSGRTRGTKRPTVNLVARAFVGLFPDVDLRDVQGRLVEMGYDLNKMVEWEDATV